MDEEVRIRISGENETGAAFNELNNQLDGVAKETASTTEKIAGLEKQFKSLAVGGGVVFGALAYAGTQLTEIGAKSVSVALAFERMTKQAGMSTDALLSSLRDASAGTIAETDLMLTANKAIALGVGEDVEGMTTLMEIARLKGQNMGLTTTQAFNDIATGIGRGSPLILDNLGITIKLGEAQENYAKELGKTVAEMTDAEKKQALLNAVLKEGKAELAATGDVALTASEQLQKMGADMDNMKSAIGEALAPTFIELGEAIAGVLKGITDFSQKNETLVRVLFGITASFSGLVAAVGLAGGAFIAFSKAAAATTAALAPLSLSISAVLVPLAGLAAVLGTTFIFYGLISDSIAKSTEQLNRNHEAIDDARTSWVKAKEGVTSYDDSLVSMTETLEQSQTQLRELAKAANDISEQMADAVKESEEKQKGYRMDKANAFIEQEEKIKDLEQQILDQKDRVRDIGREREQRKDKRAAEEKLSNLKAQLEAEKLALANANDLKLQLGDEIAEAERFRGLTEFEQKIETITMQEAVEAERLAKKLASLEEEKAAIAAQQAEIQATIAETQTKIVETEKAAARERIDAAFAEAKAVIAAEMEKAIVREQSTKRHEKALDDLIKKQIAARNALDVSDGTLQQLNNEATAISGSVRTSGSLGLFEGATVGSTFTAMTGWLERLGDIVFGDTPSIRGTARSVNDAVITPRGDIVSTHPADYLIATKSPEKLAGKVGAAGGVTININGTFLSDRQASKNLASEIMRQLGNNTRLQSR